MEKTHELRVVELNNRIADHLTKLIIMSEDNIPDAKIISDALFELVDYAMDQALVRDHEAKYR